MREILFRGKRVDNGEWIEGWYGKKSFGAWPLRDAITPCVDAGNGYLHYEETIPETVGQYTGLTDRHSNRIFEGDICRFKEWSEGKMCWVGEIQYAHQQFIISGGANEECEVPFVLQLSRFIPECLEIIGNIHDNPEMIGGADDGK